MKTTLGLVAVALSLVAVACAGGSSGDGSNAGSGDEQDIKSSSGGACLPMLTLTCAQGFELSQQGCAQSHVAGAAPLGRCVSVDVAKLVGTFANAATAEDDLSFFTITFNVDGSYSATGGCRPAGPGATACHAITQQSGTWTIAKSGPQLGAPAGASEIQLVDSFKQKQTLFYTLDGTKLSLSEAFGVGAKQSLFVKQ